MAALAAVGAHGVFVAPFRLRVTELELPLERLPPAFDGYRILVIADLHTAMPGSVAQARRAFDAAKAASPDLLVLLGDFGFSYKISRPPSRLGYARSMRKLTPMLREMDAADGVVGVLGNHDYYFDADEVARWLASWSVRVLRNEHCVITRGSERLAIVGVEDAKEGVVDAARAVAGLPSEVPRICLSHNPDGVLMLGDVHVDAVLSGHTHGGQVVLPLLGAPLRFCRICGPRHASGWVPNERAPLYVTTGVGGMIPLRINAPPEVLLVTLRRGSPQQPV